MTTQPTSLMEILAPRPNRWLMGLTRRRAKLPPGVQIVRFGEAEDDDTTTEEAMACPSGLRARKTRRMPVAESVGAG